MFFAEGTEVREAFTGQSLSVTNGAVTLSRFEDVVLLNQHVSQSFK